VVANGVGGGTSRGIRVFGFEDEMGKLVGTRPACLRFRRHAREIGEVKDRSWQILERRNIVLRERVLQTRMRAIHSDR